MKRTLFFLLIILILPVLYGCRAGRSSGAGDWDGKPLGSAPVYPLSEEPVELTWWYPIDSRVLQYMTSYADNPAFQEIQKRTGVKIKFIHPPAGNEQESFNLMIASGELPDIIQTADRYPGGEVKAWQDGVYRDLTPWMENSAPDYWKLIHSTEIAKYQAFKDGKLLAFYKLCFDESIPYIRPIVREDWLEEFGMDIPRTLDDFERYFRAIKDNKPAVTPFYIDFNGAPINQFLNAYDMFSSWYQIDGVIRHYYDAPEYRDFLERMRSWFVNGYLSKDVASLRLPQVFALFDSGQLGGYCESTDVTYSRLYDNKNIRITSTPHPRLYPGQKLRFTDPSYPISMPDANAVTTSCKYPELAIQFLNYGYTPEGILTYNYGPEGLTWTMVDGEPRFTDYYLNNPQGMKGGVLSYALRVHFGPKLLHSDLLTYRAQFADERARDIYNFRIKWSDDPDLNHDYRLLPGVDLTTEERDEYNAIMANVDAYANEMKFKFIMNAEPIENYDAYITRLYSLGYLRARDIYQGAHDRVQAAFNNQL